MIQKILITSLLIFIILFGLRFFKKIISLKSFKDKNQPDIVDLEKDPNTNEYKPKDD